MTDPGSQYIIWRLFSRAQADRGTLRLRELWILIGCALCLCTTPRSLAQQGRLVELDPSATALSVWYDPLSSTAWVGGQLQTGSNQAVMWSIADDLIVIANMLQGIDGVVLGSAVDISSNGAWVTGLSESLASTPWEGCTDTGRTQ